MINFALIFIKAEDNIIVDSVDEKIVSSILQTMIEEKNSETYRVIIWLEDIDMTDEVDLAIGESLTADSTLSLTQSV